MSCHGMLLNKWLPLLQVCGGGWGSARACSICFLGMVEAFRMAPSGLRPGGVKFKMGGWHGVEESGPKSPLGP